jgi:hypothetical protein
MKGLGVNFLGNASMKWQQFERWGMHNVKYGTTVHKAATIAKPVAAIGLAVAGAAAIFGLLASRRSRHQIKGELNNRTHETCL